MNREVNVTKRVQTSRGPRYCPVVLSANGRIKPDAVLVNGKPERHSEGAYYFGVARRPQAGAAIRFFAVIRQTMKALSLMRCPQK